MAKKYYLNPDTLLYERYRDEKSEKIIKTVATVVGTAVMVFVYFWLYLSVFHLDLPRTAILKRRRAELESKLNIVDRQLDIYEQTLSGLEQRDDDIYRSFYGLKPIPNEVTVSTSPSDFATLTDMRIDNLSKRIYIRSRSLDEVSKIASEAGDLLACMPAVPPILPDPTKFRISSGFGGRTDPVRGGYERHSGIDFATHKGNPVYATGDGVIVTTKYQFRGYGNEIVIDHGFGYQTRYAHLNTIDISEGMRVTRGDKIGTVGNTGKSTGPHLHYEVIYMDRKVNPRNYMDTSMPTDEYTAMINKRSDESTIGKKSSTMELLRRKNNGK